MRWRFSTSEHQVKIMLLAKLGEDARKIILEKWIATAQPRSGPITRATASGANLLQPRHAQQITINPGYGG